MTCILSADLAGVVSLKLRGKCVGVAMTSWSAANDTGLTLACTATDTMTWLCYMVCVSLEASRACPSFRAKSVGTISDQCRLRIYTYHSMFVELPETFRSQHRWCCTRRWCRRGRDTRIAVPLCLWNFKSCGAWNVGKLYTIEILRREEREKRACEEELVTFTGCCAS